MPQNAQIVALAKPRQMSGLRESANEVKYLLL